VPDDGRPAIRPISPQGLADEISRQVNVRHHDRHPLRVAIDAPRNVALAEFSTSVAAQLIRLGRPTVIVETSDFYRDAALRYEYGKQDVQSYYTGWLDRAALSREVLTPLANTAASYLPTLRDRQTNRSTRDRVRPLVPSGVALILGEFLLGGPLTFDVTIHFAVSAAARGRQVAADWQWTLPAYERYEAEVRPSAIADLVVRYDDPQHPAITIRQVDHC
jgi:hypothetical protein